MGNFTYVICLVNSECNFCQCKTLCPEIHTAFLEDGSTYIIAFSMQ
jgi:hypothetical protein